MSVLDSFRLDGKVAIVTGASSGLGGQAVQGIRVGSGFPGPRAEVTP